jgi:hypothetical protein
VYNEEYSCAPNPPTYQPLKQVNIAFIEQIEQYNSRAKVTVSQMSSQDLNKKIPFNDGPLAGVPSISLSLVAQILHSWPLLVR